MKLRIAAVGCVVIWGCTNQRGPWDAKEGDEDVTTSEVGGKLVEGSPRAIPNQYIVVLKDDAADFSVEAVDTLANKMLTTSGGTLRRSYQHALKGFSANMTSKQARAMANDSRVLYVQENHQFTVNAVQRNPPWALDRSDQHEAALSKTYEYKVDGSGVNAYIIDTGIRRTHQEFQGRASIAFDAIGDGQNGNDCHGHGTHVAGSIGSKTYGVAKNVKLFAVRVMNCEGSGNDEGIIAGIDWITANHVKPAVANISLGGDVSQALDDAVTKSIQAGIVYALAAGNDNADACNFSPGRTPAGITVGASTYPDAKATFSNIGPCLDLFAPGAGITSTWNTDDTAIRIIAGTSMAAPHVAGAAALYLSANPSATPAQVASALTANATLNIIGNPGEGSPNRTLYVGFIAPGTDTEKPSTRVTSPANNSSVSGTVTIRAEASDNVGVTKVEFLLDGVVLATDSASPFQADWNSTEGTHVLAARAYDAAGNVGVSANVNVTATGGTGQGRAAFDATLKAPRCTGSLVSCDTGDSLLLGRGSLGPEKNAPNTLYASCDDDSSGRFHVDESVDAMKVTTVDGTPFKAGSRVKLEVLVWAFRDFSTDTLDVWYSKNAEAAAPTWEFVSSVKPSRAGALTLSVQHTLAAGGTSQAYRAVFRYRGAAGPCVIAGYTDRDDLVFPVAR